MAYFNFFYWTVVKKSFYRVLKIKISEKIQAVADYDNKLFRNMLIL